MDTSIINTLTTVLITSFVTLFAVHLTNKANYKKLLLQSDLEKNLKQQEIEREKLEELYVHVDNWITANFAYWLPYHNVLLGELNINEVNSLTIKNLKANKHDFGRIKMLINMYFPKIKKEYDNLIEIQSSINKIIDTYKREYKDGETNGTKYIRQFHAEQELFLQKSDILITAITKLR